MPGIESLNPKGDDGECRVASFSARLFHQAKHGVDEIRKVSEDKSIQQDTSGLDFMQWFAVFSEFHNFYLHMTDRMAFTHLSEFRRSEIMSAVEAQSVKLAIETICSGWAEDRIQEIQKESLVNLRNAHEEFGQFKRVFPNPGDSPAGTLIWEFGKSVANCADRFMDMVFITRAEELAADGLVALDINAFFTHAVTGVGEANGGETDTESTISRDMPTENLDGGDEPSEAEQTTLLQAPDKSLLMQEPIPPEKIGGFIELANKMIAEEVTTPEKVAALLQDTFQGKANKFSQAFWDVLGIVNPDLRGTHDWNLIYSAIAPASEETPELKDHIEVAKKQSGKKKPKPPYTKKQVHALADRAMKFWAGKPSPFDPPQNPINPRKLAKRTMDRKTSEADQNDQNNADTSELTQVGFPKEKRAALLDLADALIEEGNDTPEKIAAWLQENYAGKANKFSQAIWGVMGSVNPELRGTPDWNAIYSSMSYASEESSELEGQIETAKQSESEQENANAPYTKKQVHALADRAAKFWAGKPSPFAPQFDPINPRGNANPNKGPRAPMGKPDKQMMEMDAGEDEPVEESLINAWVRIALDLADRNDEESMEQDNSAPDEQSDRQTEEILRGFYRNLDDLGEMDSLIDIIRASSEEFEDACEQAACPKVEFDKEAVILRYYFLLRPIRSVLSDTYFAQVLEAKIKTEFAKKSPEWVRLAEGRCRAYAVILSKSSSEDAFINIVHHALQLMNCEDTFLLSQAASSIEDYSVSITKIMRCLEEELKRKENLKPSGSLTSQESKEVETSHPTRFDESALQSLEQFLPIEIEDTTIAEIGEVTIRTLSHHLDAEMPRTTIFFSADPFDEDKTLSFMWDTSDPATLQQVHSRLLASVSENGFQPLKDAALILEAESPTRQTGGKVKLLMLITPEVAAHVTFVA